MKKMFVNKRKRGSIQDLILILVVAVFFSVLVMIAFKVTDVINTKVQSSSVIASMDTDGNARNAVSKVNSTFSGAVDNSFLFLLVGMSIITLILASLVRVHPAFMILFIIGWIFIVFIAGVGSNIYQTMAENTQMVDVANQLVYTSLIMKYLPLFIGVIGILLMIVMHKLGGENA